MMNKRNYQDIRTLEELDAAIAASRSVLRRKEDRLRRGIAAARSFYSPSALLSEGVRRASTSLSFAGILLPLLGRMHRRKRK